MNVKRKAILILKRFPKRQKGTGFIYADTIPSAKKNFATITVFTIVVSDQGDVMVRDTVFGHWNLTGRTRLQWKAWLDKHFMGIMRNTILVSYGGHFGGQWRLHTLIGWTVNANQQRGDSVVRQKRNKTKRARKRRG